MDQNDRQTIDRLFDRLAQTGQNLPARDPEAENLIQEKIARNPGAAYYMAQTVVVQEQALEAAQARIEQLEAEAARAPAPGGFLGALFGGGRSQPQPARPQPVQPRAAQRPNPWGGAAPAPGAMVHRGGGGGFLAGAAQTAVGVAGGVLLGNAIAGMLSPDAAEAAEGAVDGLGEAAGGAAEDLGVDPAAFEDMGGFDDFEL